MTFSFLHIKFTMFGQELPDGPVAHSLLPDCPQEPGHPHAPGQHGRYDM